jgi:hypothetical protein
MFCLCYLRTNQKGYNADDEQGHGYVPAEAHGGEHDVVVQR